MDESLLLRKEVLKQIFQGKPYCMRAAQNKRTKNFLIGKTVVADENLLGKNNYRRIHYRLCTLLLL